MKEQLPEYTNEELLFAETVQSISQRCTRATRQWINQEVSRDYLGALTGLTGACITSVQEYGIKERDSGNALSKSENDLLLARLVETRELLRYPRYAAATLAADQGLVDSVQLRQELVSQQIELEPGLDFPAP